MNIIAVLDSVGRDLRYALRGLLQRPAFALAAVAAGIFGFALLASLRPALEATRLDLTRSLREE